MKLIDEELEINQPRRFLDPNRAIQKIRSVADFEVRGFAEVYSSVESTQIFGPCRPV